MIKVPSIASVTVATNAARTLPKQMESLLRQSHPLDEIIVVNNASTDNTREMLSEKYPQVTVLNQAANIGVGGGFSAGLAYATKQMKYDWIWMLDDDSVPKANGLEALLGGLSLAGGSIVNIGILAPFPVHLGTQFYPGLLWRRGWVRLSPEVLRQPICFVDAVISSGSLVRSEVVEKIGLPRADFFMDFVDFEYCLRARRHGYKIGLVRDSLLEHAIGTPRTVEIFGFSRAWMEQPPWREYYSSRNHTYTVWKFYADWKTKLFTMKWLLRRAAGIVAFGENKRACLRMMLSGFVDGRAGRLGIRSLDGAPQGTSPGNPLG